MTIRLLDPTLGPVQADAELAVRPATLDGAVLGLVNNGKTRGREILERVAANLGQTYAIADTVLVTKPNASRPIAQDQVDEVAAAATAIIAAIGD